jgi:hypothetical protein
MGGLFGDDYWVNESQRSTIYLVLFLLKYLFKSLLLLISILCLHLLSYSFQFIQ